MSFPAFCLLPPALQWIVHGKLHHPRLLGIRHDKSPREVVRESSSECASTLRLQVFSIEGYALGSLNHKEFGILPMSVALESEERLIERAKSVAKDIGKSWDGRLERLLRFCARNPAAFPVPRGKKAIGSASEVDDNYLEKYVRRYYAGRNRKIVLKEVKTKPDPAVDEVLKAYKNVPPEDLQRIGDGHRLSMQAENIVGQLLESYVARLLESHEWIWCCGETMRSVDF